MDSLANSIKPIAPYTWPIYLRLFALYTAGYIGKKHLNNAIEHVLRTPLANSSRPLTFSIIRVPFFLEPHYDEKKPFIESNRQRLLQKWGGAAGWERQKNNHDLKGRGQKAGIPHFNLDRLAANSMASHRLIQMIGKTYGLHVSEAIYDLLNVYYFVDGHSLNDKPKLASVVASKLQDLVPNISSTTTMKRENMTLEEHLLHFLTGNEGRLEIEEAVRTLQELGVHGIPKFIIEGETVVDGAATADAFIEIFRDIERRGSVRNGPIFRQILGISPETVAHGSHGRSDLH